MGVSIIRNPPFTPQCGPFYRISARNPVAIAEARRHILEAVAELLDSQPFTIVSVALDPRIQDALPFFWKDFKVVPGYTYRIELSCSIDQMSSTMSSARRNDISKAGRDGLAVRQTSDLTTVRDLVMDTFERQHVRANTQHLDAVLSRFANNSNSYAFTTYQEDAALASCFIIHDARTAYYLLGGARSGGNQHHGAGALALFEAIKHAKELGLQTFDFEGSMIRAVERYFRGFGGQLTPYFTVNKAWLPLEMALKLVRRRNF